MIAWRCLNKLTLTLQTVVLPTPLKNVFRANWLEPGMHVSAIGNVELDPAVVARVDIVAVGTELYQLARTWGTVDNCQSNGLPRLCFLKPRHLAKMTFGHWAQRRAYSRCHNRS